MKRVVEEIQRKREFRKRFSEYTQRLRERSPEGKLDEFQSLRGFSLDTIKKSNIFYIQNRAELLLPEYIEDLGDFGVISNTNYKPIFTNRWVIPILDEEGEVQNLVGYDGEAVERYVYGTALYYKRAETLYGVETIEEAYKLGYLILTEGITDAIRLRELGYINSYATCGTRISAESLRKINRCRYGVIKIPDRDNPGLGALKKWETNRGITLKVAIQYKDLDEMCKEGKENQELLKQYIDACIGWIKKEKHMGVKGVNEEVTIV